MGKKRDGRSFWQPDGTKEVREFAFHEWAGLWQAPPPPEASSVWRETMKSQKQAILQSHYQPLNGHRYPGRKKTLPRKPRSVGWITRTTAPPATSPSEAHRVSQSTAIMSSGPRPEGIQPVLSPQKQLNPQVTETPPNYEHHH